jgi:16S rRNA (guanine966-N2)-methyltransferase
MAAAGRVIAGSARGIRLIAPGEGTRPLGDRVKQTLFAILEPQIRGRSFLDLFAGSGAAGIEALSRGASSAVFVDADRRAVETIRRNLDATNLGAGATVSLGDVRVWLAHAGAQRERPPRFAAVLVDPPYEDQSALADAVQAIARHGPNAVLASDGVLVAKHFWKVGRPPRIGLLRSVREVRFGETMLTFYRWGEGGEG